MSQKEPKYQQIVDWVKENMANGTLRYGDKLMSEKELSDKFNLSRQTVRHATGELVEQRLVTRVQGSGTYIGSSYMPVRKEKFMSIAVVSTFYESYIFPPTLKGIESVLSQAGYSMQVSFTDNKISRERAILKNILEKDNVDGLIIEPAKSALPNPNLKYYRMIREKNIPIICFNARYRGLNAPCVRLDDTGVARKATELLLKNGHQKIAGLFKADDGQGPLRYQGFMEAMIQADVHFDQQQILWLDTPMTVSLKDIEEYVFERIKGCTAVVCYNDQVAYQLIELAGARGIRVPEDLSVVGIDDSYLAGVSRVPFTSFPHPKDQLGRKVAENMVSMIDNPEFDGNYLFDADPVLRSSVKTVF